MAHTRLREFSILSPLSLGSVSKALRRKQAWVVEDKRWKRTHSVSLMPHALRLRQAPQATESAPEETTELSLFPRSAPEASLFSLVTSQGSQRGTLHPYLCLRALVLIHRLPRLALICTLTHTPLVTGGPVTWPGLHLQDDIHSYTGASWTSHQPPVIIAHTGEGTFPECQLCKGLLSTDSWKKKPLFSHQKVPLHPVPPLLGPFHRTGLALGSGGTGWVEGENSAIWGGQSNLLGVANPALSLREAQSVAELHLWGWVRKGGSVPPLHS